MLTTTQTPDQRERERQEGGGAPAPGLVLVFTGGRPCHMTWRVDGVLEVGRKMLGDLEDKVMSRLHARVSREGGSWRVEDLGSRNGTAVDGKRLTGETRGRFRVLRAGGSLFLLVDDVLPYETPVEKAGGMIIGAALRSTWQRIRRSGSSATLHITGETGSGKELAARTYHLAGPRPTGPFVAVNCAAIPEGVAERLLFGAKKGAFSDAVADAEGYLQAAHGGTLFLDEVGELGLVVQGKLLRVLESGEVLALGASRPAPVSVQLCSATHHDLRALVAAKRFREDLYYRLARPDVMIPPLRERLDEVAELCALAVRQVDARLTPHVSLVETCLLRAWPGNVRELLSEVGDAARQVSARTSTEATVMAVHLADGAGRGMPRPLDEPIAAPQPGVVTPLPPRAAIEEALRAHRGQVASAARALGLRRNQLRRWLVAQRLDPRRFGGG